MKRPAEHIQIMPVPNVRPEIPVTFRGNALTRKYAYKNTQSEVLFYVLRFDKPDGGKDVVPITLWGDESGTSLTWQFKAPPAPRPLFGLWGLAKRPDAPVLICEGEKATEAARKLQSDMVCVTSMGGARAAKQTDWTPLQGRQIFVWPDNDKPGAEYARDVCRLAHDAGAKISGILSYEVLAGLRNNCPISDGWDAADAMEEGGFPPDFITTPGLFVAWEPTKQDNRVDTRDDDIDPRLIVDPSYPVKVAEHLVEHVFTDASGVGRVRHLGAEFYVHEGTHYAPQSREIMRSVIYRHLAKLFMGSKTGDVIPLQVNQHMVSTVMDALTGIRQVRRPEMPRWIGPNQASRPAPQDMIAFQNGLIQLNPDTGEVLGDLLPHTPYWFSANVLSFDYDPSADCPHWLNFLHDISDGDSEWIRALQMWLGYQLVPDSRQHKIALFMGPARSGKSTVLRVMEAVIGPHNCCGPTLSKLGGEFGLAPLIGKLSALCGDAHLGRSSDRTAILESLKKISGGDPVDVNRKYLPHRCGVRMTTRFTIAVNELLNLPDASNALSARLIIFPFNKSFLGKENLSLTESLVAEAPGICCWAMRGLQDLRREGRLIVPKSGRELHDEFRRLSSPVLSFVQDSCATNDPSAEIGCNELYRAFQLWCERTGHEPGSANTFGSRLKVVLPHIKRIRIRSADSSRQWVYCGIHLSPFGDDKAGAHG